MPKNTVTLALNGDVGLGEYTRAISSFRDLIHALSQEVNSTEVEWVIHDLQVSSAIATIRGEADQPEKIENVVRAYGQVGYALESGKRPDFSDRVVHSAKAISGILNGCISSVRFETADIDATILKAPDIVPPEVIQKSYGAIEGRVETLSKRKGLRFTLYDVLRDRAVACYVQEGQEELMREIWGKRALIHGEISRELPTGRPVAIRKITDIQVLQEAEKGSYLRARAIAPRQPTAPLAEDVIRQLRDA